MPKAHRAHLLALTHDTREAILERFIGTSVKELRSLLLAAPPPASVGESDGEASGEAEVVGASGAAALRGSLNTSEHAEAVELAVDLLLHHEVDPENNDTKNTNDLVELLELVTALELTAETADGGDAAAKAAAEEAAKAAAAAAQGDVTRPGTKALILEAAVEWRRQKGVQDAASMARKLLLAEQENEVDIATAGTPTAIAAAAASKTETTNGAVVAGPPANLSSLLAIGLAGYDVPATMSDQEVLVEYLQLLSLEQNSLTTATSYWLMDAIVSYRAHLADAAAAAVAANATASDAPSNAKNTTSANSTARTGPPPPPPLLTLLDQALPAHVMLDSNSSYPLIRARSTLASTEDFAVVIASVLQAYNVHSRIAILCSVPPPTSATAEPSTVTVDDIGNADAAAAAVGPCRRPGALDAEECKPVADMARAALRAPDRKQCRTLVEVRLGKSPKKMAGWVAAHRKSLRSQGRKPTGAKKLHFSTDSDGYVWLPLSYHPSANAEQVPGGAYPENVTLAIHYPLPLAAGRKGPVWSFDQGGVDSEGRRLPSGAGGVGSVLSTM